MKRKEIIKKVEKEENLGKKDEVLQVGVSLGDGKE